jgi:hypothetical protein
VPIQVHTAALPILLKETGVHGALIVTPVQSEPYMRLTAVSVALFLLAFAVHWLTWRVRIPQRQTRALLLIFLGTLPLGLLVLVFLPKLYAPVPAGLAPLVQVALFHVSAAFVYIVLYSLLEEQSPTLSLVKLVADAPASGRTRAELFAHLEAIQYLQSRLEALLRDGLLREENGVYHLTSKGRSWARSFRWWRRVLHIGVGG